MGPSRRTGTRRGTLEDVRDGSGSLPEVDNGLGDPRGSPGRDEEPSGRLGKGRGTPRGGTGRDGGPSERFGTGRGTLGKVREGSRDLWGGPGRVEGPSGGLVRVGRPSLRFGQGRGTLREVLDGSGDPQRGL